MKKLILFFLAIFLFQLVVAECSGNQIDVNSASLSELDEITGIGPAKAQAIIDARQYESLDDLTNAYGIGPATLERIKSQGLACVSSEVTEPVKEQSDSEVKPESEEDNLNELKNFADKKVEQEEARIEAINLMPQTIKSEENSEGLGNKRAIYGLVIFCILLAILSIVKYKPKKEDQNEFDE
ncbi:hypothetical protein HN832_02775 [archaeon]|jgi:competence ComEA-like helix-hairpin-helix protein|nr:hypothetical protein [archaeon]MBT4373279.1 hypothetical protein [archaeon]MBT4531624.1 hypothetical protein [archaeon]MBT7001198.1 hypothetical protein [archaeon]MBT7282316.1 hypothetical protein [archaeon]